MRKISQATEIIGLIERGDLNADLSREITDVLKSLQDQVTSKGKVKGSVMLTLSFSVQENSVEIAADIKSKVPRRQRSNSFFFVTSDGALTTEHPNQVNMFDEVLGGKKTAN